MTRISGLTFACPRGIFRRSAWFCIFSSIGFGATLQQAACGLRKAADGLLLVSGVAFPKLIFAGHRTPQAIYGHDVERYPHSLQLASTHERSSEP
jgi:hypothetical protein